MTWINSWISPQQAAALSLDVWELQIDNWGNYTVPSADRSSLIFPPPGVVLGAPGSPGIPSCAAIAVGPQSTVDRCFIAYDILLSTLSTTIFQKIPRRLTRSAPLLFPQQGNGRGVVNDMGGIATSTGNIAVSAQIYNPGSADYNSATSQTRFTQTYSKVDNTSANFADAAVAADPDCAWFSPFLHLLFYLTPPTQPPPTRRAPAFWRVARSISFGADNVEVLAGQYPIMGRDFTRVSLVTASTVLSYRIGGVNLASGQETTLASGVLAANTQARIAIDAPDVDYLMVYYIRAGAHAGATLRTDVYTIDRY